MEPIWYDSINNFLDSTRLKQLSTMGIQRSFRVVSKHLKAFQEDFRGIWEKFLWVSWRVYAEPAEFSIGIDGVPGGFMEFFLNGWREVSEGFQGVSGGFRRIPPNSNRFPYTSKDYEGFREDFPVLGRNFRGCKERFREVTRNSSFIQLLREILRRIS